MQPDQLPPRTQAGTAVFAAAAAIGIPPGHKLLERYVVRRLLGRGAMGEVLEVSDERSGLNYALKRVPAEVARDALHMKQIRANFALVSQLTHPHIAAMRQLEIDAQGQVYLVMDLVRGPNLAEWLSARREEILTQQGLNAAAGAQMLIPLPAALVVGLAEQIAVALDYAHSQPVAHGPDGKPKLYGILHRDLKPANVMAESDREYRPGVPYLRLVDFGLAAEIQASLQSISVKVEKPMLAGTPLYMAPEQWEGRTLTRGVDQWALAVIMYELLAGRPPFSGPSETAIANQICRAEPEKPAHLSEAQWLILKRTLQSDRTRRHESCLALVKAFAQATGDPAAVVSLPVLPIPESAPLALLQSTTLPSAKQVAPRGPRHWVLAAVLLIVFSIGAGGYYYWRETRFNADLDHVLQAAGRADHAHGQVLSAAILSLEEFKRTHSARSAQELQRPSQQLEQLRERQKALEKRTAEFQALLTESQRLLASDPAAALARLQQAELAGQADDQYPELLSALSPSLERRRSEALAAKSEAEARAAAAKAIEAQRLAEARVAAARLDFAAGFDAAKFAAAQRAWQTVEKSLVQALQTLGTLDHPAKHAAELLLAQARAEQKKPGEFAEKLKAADTLLASGQLAQAQAAYTDAKRFWPESPDIDKAEVGIKVAGLRLAEERYRKALDEAHAALARRDWRAAETAYERALSEKANDAAALKGKAAAQAGAAEESYAQQIESAARAMAAKQWLQARTIYSRVLTSHPEDPKATEGAAKADAELKNDAYAAALVKAKCAQAAAQGSERDLAAWIKARQEARNALLVGHLESSEAQMLFDQSTRGEQQARQWQESDQLIAKANELSNQKEWAQALATLHKALELVKRTDQQQLQARLVMELARSKGESYWKSNQKLLEYKGHQLLVGVRGDEVAKYALIGRLALAETNKVSWWVHWAGNEVYTLHDLTDTRLIVLETIRMVNVASAAKGEYNDYIGEAVSTKDGLKAELRRVRQYNKTEGGSGNLYLARVTVKFATDGADAFQLEQPHWGKMRHKVTSREVPDETAKKMFDDFEQKAANKDKDEKPDAPDLE